MTLQEQKQFIAENYLEIPVKRLAKQIGRSYSFVTAELKRQNLVIPPEIIEARKNIGRYKPGHIPMTKGMKQEDFMSPEMIERTKATRFKKGQKSHTEKPDFSITFRKHKGKREYYWIRISKNNWVQLHRYLWTLAYGPIPEGHIVQFKDGNQRNVTLENLYLTTRNKQATINKMGGHKIPYELRETINLIYQLKSKVDEKQNH